MAGLDIGILLGGAILTETVFNIPGIGRYAYDAIINVDLPAIQGTVLFGAFFIILAEPVRGHRLRVPRSAGQVLSGAPRGREPARPLRDAGRRGQGGRRRLTLRRTGRTLGIVGESGHKSVTAMTVMGLTRAPNATIEGHVPPRR